MYHTTSSSTLIQSSWAASDCSKAAWVADEASSAHLNSPTALSVYTDVKQRGGFGACLAADAKIALESSPPLSVMPKGTSLRRRMRTASSNNTWNSATARSALIAASESAG